MRIHDVGKDLWIMNNDTESIREREKAKISMVSLDKIIPWMPKKRQTINS